MHRIPSRLVQTIRAVGKVSEALTRLSAGDTLGLRGPFGTAWPVADGYGRDVVVVAGGLGLAPLRPALYQLQAERKRFGKLVLLYGTRRPEDILFRRQLARLADSSSTWRSRSPSIMPAPTGAVMSAW